MKWQRILIWVFIILFVITLQSTIIPRLSILRTSPDLVVATIMVLAIWHGRMSGIWGGFFTGLLLDIWAPPEQMGLNALALTLTGAFIGIFDSRKMNSGPIFQFFFFILGSSIHDIVIYLNTSSDSESFSLFLFSAVIPRALFTALFGVMFVLLGAQLNPYERR